MRLPCFPTCMCIASYIYGSGKLNISVNSESYRRSFTFKEAMEWNKLPSNLRGVGSVVTFRNSQKRQNPERKVDIERDAKGNSMEFEQFPFMGVRGKR